MEPSKSASFHIVASRSRVAGLLNVVEGFQGRAVLVRRVSSREQKSRHGWGRPTSKAENDHALNTKGLVQTY
jgi:hypothetical protein